MKILTRIEIEALVDGATILGVGGGGSPERGLASLLEQFDRGRKLVLASIDELNEDDLLASPYFVGSVAPTVPKIKLPAVIDDPIAQAIKLLEEKLGRKVAGTVASEIGGGNTAASLAIAAKLGIPMVDGDLMGRAGPELHQSTVHIFGFTMYPAAIVSNTGNQMVVDSYASIDDYEAIARYASVISQGHVAVVDTPLTKPQAKRCVIQGMISKCIAIGNARKNAVQKNEDAAKAVTKELRNGKIIFSGKVSNYSWKDERGFLLGEAQIEGNGEWKGSKLKSWIMNEHIMCWINEKPAVMSPDLIAFLDPRTGAGVTNDKLAKDMDVIVVGASINDVWRTPRGLDLFGPRHFGFAFDYVPFEKLS